MCVCVCGVCLYVRVLASLCLCGVCLYVRVRASVRVYSISQVVLVVHSLLYLSAVLFFFFEPLSNLYTITRTLILVSEGL